MSDDASREHSQRAALAEGNDAEYLAALGERVRRVRLRRGMTRSMLSEHSGVSERYLAQLEGGRGNVSIRLLRRIARAMDVPVADLVHEGPEPPVELRLITEQLQRLAPDELKAVQEVVSHRFTRSKHARSRRIALIGLRGAGKTTLGTRLAERLGLPFVKLVRETEREAGMDVREILALSGQQGYRRLEERVLTRVIERYPEAVIEAGGGLVTEPATFNFLLSACYTVWLRATPEEHMSRVLAQGDHRPMAGSAEAMEDLRRILTEREPFYREADAVLDTSGRTVEACVDALEEICREQASLET
ncbi:MAG: helix-turn-helix transcriptional regulator [Gammaproteobacteria bacterium]|nr:helix-turn-helix transcriptional regulator [Gammaproteobacteria bacterium]NIR84765.1 helix-turn-helix transcriptional regulator [Gammaproteobacteria bacterium]NIR91261.1 helix-turn-helix transcriptional regulator [Gammaproteobacteria bacterium]NIU05808.1 helix-turn-helix transcriptional regulator [Gammaproteobacteria bacterium]NIV52927.1 helix-turn-helix domain-containing protein [Gammaproteobacteria bacterium]